MKQALQRQDNLNGLTLDSVQKTRQRAILAQQSAPGHWLQVTPRERRLVKGLKRELFEVEKEYLAELCTSK